MIAPMRRNDRQIDEAQALDILDAGEYGILSLVAAPGRLAPAARPYAVPVSYALMDGGIVFHCATQGLKVDLMRAEGWASFCVVGRTRVLPGRYTTLYESAIVQGPVSECTGEAKFAALRCLARKYANYDSAGLEKYLVEADQRVCVFRIAIEHLSGKARQR